LLENQIDGKPLDDQHLHGMLRLLLIAGIDTTWSGIGVALWHLARTPTDRDRLVAEPALMPTAIEEFLRSHLPPDLCSGLYLQPAGRHLSTRRATLRSHPGRPSPSDDCPQQEWLRPGDADDTPPLHLIADVWR
jgi:hypothetical protein